MAKGYNAPAEVRELEKQINDFTYRNGLDVKTVFQDLLRYIVHGFSLPDTPPLSDWRYNKEQTKVFYDMFATWIQIMSQQIKRHGWYDAFGDLFMALTSQSGQQQKGQFFTPAHITDLMSKITMGKQESDAKILSVCDPTAGSGRTLLAAKADRPQSYLVAWDIDYTCCLMCVCNFLLTGCVEHVVSINNKKKKKTIEYYLYLKNWIDAVQWHFEDIIRDPQIDPVEALALKRRIDKSNQDRTDLVELIDSYFLDKYKAVKPLSDATINTESPAWAIDRLSILALKIYHMKQEVERTDTTEEHREQCRTKLNILLEQQKDLSSAIEQLLADIEAGRKYMKVYKQMKMYNDPALNPVLYAKK